MDLLHHVCQNIEKWINSCKTQEQLELCKDIIKNYVNTDKFPNENPELINAMVATLNSTIRELTLFPELIN